MSRVTKLSKGNTGNSTSRNYMFTAWDDPLEAMEKSFVNLCIKYGIVQKECCPETKKEHWQGYIELSSPKRMAGVKKLLEDDSIHLEVRKGTKEEAIAYCEKLESRIEGPWEFGHREDKGQGKRSDLDRAVELAKTMNMKEIAKKVPKTYCMYNRGLEKLRNCLKDPRDFKTEVFVFWGKSGSGKSHRASKLCGKDVYWKPPGKWFDGYDGQESIILDDYNPYDFDEIDFQTLLRLMDCWPMLVPVKGSFVQFVSKRLVITSNINPKEWGKIRSMKEEHEQALIRRIEHIEECKEVFVGPPVASTENLLRE